MTRGKATEFARGEAQDAYKLFIAHISGNYSMSDAGESFASHPYP